MKKYFLLVLPLALIKITASAQKIINLTDYGVVSNSYQNASAKIARAIKDLIRVANLQKGWQP